MRLTPLENWIAEKSGIAQKSQEALLNYQLEKIRETLCYAKTNSRFYGNYLKDIQLDEIRSLADFRKIPFTRPSHISGNPLEFLCVPQREIKRIVTLKSSGTTGNEKRIYFTKEDLEDTVEFFKYGMRCLTDEKDRVLVLLPGVSYGSIGNLLKEALSENGTACFVSGVMSDARLTAQCIEENGISCIVGIPIQIMQLARMQKETFKKVKKVLLSTDYVPKTLIDELSEEYGCRVFTHYGMTEMGYGGGVECEALCGYHMREADLFFEIVDPVSGRTLPDGQAGEVVFTTLTRKAMPLIRYRTGDIASFSKKPCDCGTFLKTMERVRGRLNNRIILKNNMSLSLSELDEIILPFRKVMDFGAYLSEDCRLIIEIAAQSDKDFLSEKDKIKSGVQDFIFDKFGAAADLPVEVKRKSENDSIKNSMVKRKIHDLRKNE